MRAGDRDEVRHLDHAGRHLLDLLAEGRVAGVESAAQQEDETGGDGHREHVEDDEPRHAHRGDDEREDDVDHRHEPGVEKRAQELFDRFDVAQDLALEFARALSRVETDGELLEPAADRGAQLRLHVARRPAHEAHVDVVRDRVLHEDDDEHDGVPPQLGARVLLGLRDDVDHVGREQRHQPHGAVLDHVKDRAPDELPAFWQHEILQGAQRVLTLKTALKRAGTMLGSHGNVTGNAEVLRHNVGAAPAQGSQGYLRASGLRFSCWAR
ncbi:MAG: hypothetical protein BWX86_02657 [Verrucomicrobia bacterium ADurb.Bin122]|nr:MAG: hypothetical protein BWX86_02657 [Verrucomicrobia bacterium ADurb.Bin122]